MLESIAGSRGSCVRSSDVLDWLFYLAEVAPLVLQESEYATGDQLGEPERSHVDPPRLGFLMKRSGNLNCARNL